jgi:hypothetical protein
MAKKIPMNTSDSLVKINRAKVDSIDLYEITDYELLTIENGSQESLFLNIAISCISIFFSGLLCILTASFNSEIAKIVAIVLTTISLFAFIIFIIIWRNYNKSSANIFTKIKSRLSQPVIDTNIRSNNKTSFTIESPDPNSSEG